MKADGVLLHSIARGLENMQNISSIVYSPHQHTIPMEVKTLRDLLPRGAPSRALIDDRTTNSDHPFRQLIGAIFMSDYTGIRQLKVEAPREGYPCTELSLDMFTFPEPDDLHATKHLFRHLVRLDFNLSILDVHAGTSRPLTIIDPPVRELENLAKVLEAAQDLRYLSFGILNWRYLDELMRGGSFPEGSSIIDCIGLRATWPKLRSLKLEGVYARESDLCELINRHKDTLRSLIFARSTLCVGMWVEVVNEVVFNASMITTFVLDKVNEHRGIGAPINENKVNQTLGYEGHLTVAKDGEREFVRSNPVLGFGQFC